MPDIFTSDVSPIKTKGSDFVHPIREATPLLVGKIIFALLLPLIIYLFILVSSIQLVDLFSFSEDWSLGFVLFLGGLTIIQILLVLLITLQWKSHVFYITDTYIQENKGILIHTEKMYDLKNVRDVSVRQGILGRIWNFGDIIIESTAPGDFHEVLIMYGTPQPHDHEAFLQKLV